MFAHPALGSAVVDATNTQRHRGEERQANLPTPRPHPFLSVTGRCQQAIHPRLRREHTHAH